MNGPYLARILTEPELHQDRDGRPHVSATVAAVLEAGEEVFTLNVCHLDPMRDFAEMRPGDAVTVANLRPDSRPAHPVLRGWPARVLWARFIRRRGMSESGGPSDEQLANDALASIRQARFRRAWDLHDLWRSKAVLIGRGGKQGGRN